MLNEIKRTDFDTGITLQVAIKENRYKSLNLICIAKKKKIIILKRLLLS